MRQLLIAFFIIALAACGGSSDGAFLGGGTGGQASTFTPRITGVAVTTGPTAIVANGTSQTFVRATVTDQAGSPMSGQTVGFSATAGSLSTTSVSTDDSGVAQTILTSSTAAGRSIVTVSVVGFTQQTEIDFEPGQAVAANSSISANPGALPADGASTATVTVVAADANGNLVNDGTAITLLSTAGSVTSSNPVNSSLGRAEFTLQAASTAQDATLTVRVNGSAVAGLSQNISFGTVAAGDPTAVQIAPADPTSITVRDVGRDSQSQLTFTVVDGGGNAIDESGYNDATLNNVRVRFLTRPNGGESIGGTDANGNPQNSGAASFLDIRTVNGAGAVTLQAGTLPGTVELQVQVLAFDGTDFDAANDVAVSASLPQMVIASGPPHTLVFTSSNLNAIVNEGQGVYSRLGKIIVTDQYGNAVPDGTVISLGYVDSVIAHSNQGQKSASDTTVTATNSLLELRCVSSINCAADTFDFDSTIQRNNTARGVEPNDRVLMLDAVEPDKARFVSTTGSATMLTAQSAYNETESGLQTVIGSSLSGGLIAGLDENNVETVGSASTTDGVASFRVRYQANVDVILNGCYGYALDGTYSTDDKRWQVPQSAQSWTVAISNETDATAVDRAQFCFASIAGATLTPLPSSIKGGSGTFRIGLTLQDGGDQIRLPFVPLTFSVRIDNIEAGSQFAVTADILENAENLKEQTNIGGTGAADIIVSGPGCQGDAATVTFFGADASVDVTVEIAADEDAACAE